MQTPDQLAVTLFKMEINSVRRSRTELPDHLILWIMRNHAWKTYGSNSLPEFLRGALNLPHFRVEELCKIAKEGGMATTTEELDDLIAEVENAGAEDEHNNTSG